MCEKCAALKSAGQLWIPEREVELREKNLLVKIGAPILVVLAVLAVVMLTEQGPGLAGVILLLFGALSQTMTSAYSIGLHRGAETGEFGGQLRGSTTLAGWILITCGAFFSLLAALPVPDEESKPSSNGWWIFTHEWMLQLFSGTIGALMGAVVAAAAAVWVLNRTNGKQQSLWDASKREEEQRSSKSRQMQSAADLSESILKLLHATDTNEEAVIETSYLSTIAYIRWSADLFGKHEDYRKEMGRWIEEIHLDARALRNLRDYKPATAAMKEEHTKLRAEFEKNIVHFIKTTNRWLAEEGLRKQHFESLKEGSQPGGVARRIRDDLKIPTPWLPKDNL